MTLGFQKSFERLFQSGTSNSSCGDEFGQEESHFETEKKTFHEQFQKLNVRN